MTQQSTRKRPSPVKVYCLPEQRAQLRANASATHKSLSTYLLHAGLGYRILSFVDQRRIDALLRIHADQGRLGGLIKLWLTNDERVAVVGEPTLRALLAKIQATQEELREVIRSVQVARDEGSGF